MPKKVTKQSYQKLSQQLDEEISKLKDPNVSIDDATQHYERAMELNALLEGYLDDAENNIRYIKAKFGQSDD
jgi:exodeoxyribonuclease VII small subunit